MDIKTLYTKEQAVASISDPDQMCSYTSSNSRVPYEDALNDLATECHARAVVAGWWDTPQNFGEKIALGHSELSEALAR